MQGTPLFFAAPRVSTCERIGAVKELFEVDIKNLVEEICNAWVVYASDTSYVIKMYMSDNEFDGERYLISDDGTEHRGYIVVNGCSNGVFWFDLYSGEWESEDSKMRELLCCPEVRNEINRRFGDVAKCLGPKASGVNEKEVWRKIISLHLKGDYSLVPNIIVMHHYENANSNDPASFAPKKCDKSWEIKSLSYYK